MNKNELHSRLFPVHEDMRMQQSVWTFERVGWYALVIIVLLALAGVFGNGPLSNAEAVSADGKLRVQYQRLSRTGTVDTLRIMVQGSAGKPLTVTLDGTLFREASIETMQPAPLSSMSKGQALLLQLGTSNDGLATLYLTVRSEYVGTLRGMVEADPGTAVSLSTFLFP